jgi:nucleoside phosphorylase
VLLLTIAHQGEAQEFIKRKHTQTAEFHFNGLYRSQEELLLLTGEGIQMTTLRLASVCTYFGQRIDRVLNLGIAGSLDPSLQINQFYGIHRVHHELAGKPGYPSFNCKETSSHLDCVTSLLRVLNHDYAATLQKIAPIVDRELWAIASVCQLFHLPFKSYKLISDQAGITTDSPGIKAEGEKTGKHLFDFYKNLTLTKEVWD